MQLFAPGGCQDRESVSSGHSQGAQRWGAPAQGKAQRARTEPGPRAGQSPRAGLGQAADTAGRAKEDGVELLRPWALGAPRGMSVWQERNSGTAVARQGSCRWPLCWAVVALSSSLREDPRVAQVAWLSLWVLHWVPAVCGCKGVLWLIRGSLPAHYHVSSAVWPLLSEGMGVQPRALVCSGCQSCLLSCASVWQLLSGKKVHMLLVLQVLQPTGTALLLERPMELCFPEAGQPSLGGRRCSVPVPGSSSDLLSKEPQAWLCWSTGGTKPGTNTALWYKRITFFCGIIKYNWAWSEGCLWKSSSFWLCNVLLKLNDNKRSYNHVRNRYNPNLRKIQDLKLIHWSRKIRTSFSLL